MHPGLFCSDTNENLEFLSFLTVLQGAFVFGSLESPAGCRTFPLCCDGLDLQPVQTERVQARHHQDITILKERRQDKQ